MKKIVMLGLAALMSAAMMAQNNERFDPAKMAQHRAEQMSKTLELKGDAKTEFEHLYMQYFVELMGKIERPQAQTGEQTEGRRGKKEKKEELSTEEANKQLQEMVERQEKQVADAQRRLEVTKKYIAEFSKTLTPQQVLKVMQPRMPQGGRQGMMPGGANMPGMRGMRGMQGGNRGGFGGGFGGNDF